MFEQRRLDTLCRVSVFPTLEYGWSLAQDAVTFLDPPVGDVGCEGRDPDGVSASSLLDFVVGVFGKSR